MTKTEIATAIVSETRTRMWKEAESTPGLQIQMIVGMIDELHDLTASELADATKQVKKRKPRKAKAPAPLTQHAEGIGDY